MKAIRSIVACLIALVLATCASTTSQKPKTPVSTAHYYDLYGSSLEALDPIWQAISDFLGATSPEKITLVYGTGPQSRFDPITDTIKVQLPGSGRLVAHESAHLFISHLTEMVSITQPLRFIDEGLASILGNKISGTLAFYRKESHNIAVDQLGKDLLSLDQLQNWKTYRAEHGPYIAYSVGSSFVFFILETQGNPKLSELLRSLSTTQDLGKSSEAVFGDSLENIFSAWLETLKTTPKYELPSQPAIVDIFPEPGAVDVPTDIKEIRVTFNVFMGPRICVRNVCDNSGICHTNARWESHQKLVIPVTGKVLPGHHYQLSLGSEEGCLLKTSHGVEMPITQWEFTTGE